MRFGYQYDKPRRRKCRYCNKAFTAKFKSQTLCENGCLQRSRRGRHSLEREKARALLRAERKDMKMWAMYGRPGWIGRMANHDCDREKCDLAPANMGRGWWS